ncbi:transposase domain-containing protein [Novosphingobium sp. AAP1]|uniref:transposase domain-containing protein n=1 Tax=Novosphingobium sp. AAP1 TaxID=1523413 RepID=UPI0009EBFA54|nr:transposase domain-containing protein [Novosphingobium sp. AAP1]
MCELTARVNDANPLTWFTNVLARIAYIRQTRLHELLPWHCRVAQQRHIQGNCCLNSAGSAPASRWAFIKSRRIPTRPRLAQALRVTALLSPAR